MTEPTSYKDSRYVMPNDDDEKDRLDLRRMLSSSHLTISSISLPSRPTCLTSAPGPGSGPLIFADKHPNSCVIFVDLSPTQNALYHPMCLSRSTTSRNPGLSTPGWNSSTKVPPYDDRIFCQQARRLQEQAYGSLNRAAGSMSATFAPLNATTTP
ncbi:hypothetical protein jhhlp_001195 [Lomentospora prolificans]|uniref:Uncharacterized protein n=1 Tax=Lomentospora prolificans TaxID=41688 RepID=A0A2N3NHM8_9PEZI|nr:hypothetical protein jhhlp_001195 [Lomentospora prolificans]